MLITEETVWEAGTLEEGVIRDVRILGKISKNKRVYPEATRQRALPLLEGAAVNLDHKNKSVTGRFGRIKNVRNTPDYTLGDLHYITKHHNAGAIQEMAECFPELLGMSISAKGREGKKDESGNTIIEDIEEVYSVDLVATPASNRNLFEEVEEENTELTKLRNEKACRALLEEQKVEVENHLLEVLSYLPDNLRENHVKWLNKKKSKPITTRLPEPEKQKDLDYYENILRGGK